MKWRSAARAVWLTALVVAVAPGQQPESPVTGEAIAVPSAALVGRQADESVITPGDQVLTPLGRQVPLEGLRPQSLALSPDGRLLVTAGKTPDLVVIDPATGLVLARVVPSADDAAGPDAAGGASARNLAPDRKALMSLTGLTFSPDGTRLFMSNVQGSVKVFTVADGTVAAAGGFALPPAAAPQRAAEIPCGLAVSADGSRLYVCGNLSNRLLELDAASGRLLRAFDVGVAPFDVVLAGGRAYVSNLGGRRPASDDLTGPAGRGTRVRVDPVRHIASEGTVSRIDLADGAGTEIAVGLHPSGLAVAPGGRVVVCANAGSDTLSLIDDATGRVVETVWTKRTPAELFGAQPAALAFAPDGARLYVANAAQNAIAVMEWEPEQRGGTRLVGQIPVGWHPAGVVVDAPRGQLAVANLRGLPDKPRRQAGGAEGFNSHQHAGSVSLVPLPDGDLLAACSERVARNLRAGRIAASRLPAREGVPARAIPERVGEPSLIEHVVYVIKENRTYDQVFGDMPQGRGRPELCIFGERVTPNQHALARRWVLLDNTYCCGILSADGHNWSTSALANDYLQRSFAGFPRSYPDGMEDADADALAWSSAGFIWDACRRGGKSLRNYGEFMMPRVAWRDPAKRGQPDFRACYAAWKAGAGDVVFASAPAIESLRDVSATDTVGWNMSVPDQFRADRVLAELAAYEARGHYPHLVIICLPQDHTSGTAKNCPTPEACMADNDLAFGRIVAGLSRSRFWAKMAVFAIEDDPQAGWDHVSGYRTTAYVASPYARRGVTVSTHYNTTSILRTIGQILGLPPMNQFDAAATPMFDCFTDEPDLEPFTVVPANVPLDQMNGDPQSLRDPLLRDHAVASAAIDFSAVDRAPEDLLNRILWHAVKGSAEPYPEWATTAATDPDGDD
jgi:DNA-binding beta-propeller fold protein YncE